MLPPRCGTPYQKTGGSVIYGERSPTPTSASAPKKKKKELQYDPAANLQFSFCMYAAWSGSWSRVRLATNGIRIILHDTAHIVDQCTGLDTNGDFGEDHQFFQAGWSSRNPKFIEPLCLD
ncbi:hypothetical protein DPMN_118651 [Dreissena polymorpha]|uniref:Uncharacterized protein n=1 Tax=Dreissena polymorpha TaxID=45954 RepID=A0A9D4GHT5_DREPO|nr:hypothetical protein DPMN_118651 [Dreissena polymorpha]